MAAFPVDVSDLVVVRSLPPHLGHGEDGQLEPTCNFPYDEVDQSLFGAEARKELNDLSAADFEAASRVFRALVSWMWQNGMKNPQGLNLRAIIVCWVFLEHLRPLTLTELARAFGKKKQSLGRWVDDFKRAFPRIRNSHMKE